ncbi:transcriptional regulator [Mycobacterium shigaense]|uniref:Transcriptional regulator n=2 Tax=Mycobacterium shigaense TaxID=722731 RepID=A0A1Z4EBC1_9MYCO|nr:transcriptional regulator [Mycobacterium shigaense]
MRATCYVAVKARGKRMSSYTDRREQILNDLSPEDRAVFDEAYATASLAMELAETAYRARETAGLTQAELARKMGTTQSAIAAIESGARTPTVELLERLARACGRRLTISIDAA